MNNQLVFYDGDPNRPGQSIRPTLINSYSTLTIPTYKLAMDFVSSNLASFPRQVFKDGSIFSRKHRLDKILKRKPNTYQNSFVFWRTLYFHWRHFGNAYARIEQPAMALHLMHPYDVVPFRVDGGQWYYHKTTKTVHPAADILHLSLLSEDGMCGYDPSYLHSDTFQRSKTLEKYATQYVQKGTVVRGSIEIPAGVSKEQVEDIVTTLKTHFSGESADRDVIVLSDGATLKNSTISAQASQIAEQSAISDTDIARITGIPPHFLFIFKDAKYNNLSEQMGDELVRFTFRPMLEQVEDELSLKLFSEAEQDNGYRVNINPDALLRGSTTAQSANIRAEVNEGLRTPNEGRDLLGLPPDPNPESDKLRLPVNLVRAPGNDAPKPTAPETAEQPETADEEVENSAAPSVDYFAALKPLIDQSAQRVETKTTKAFENASKKEGQELTIWSNVFADQQRNYVRESFSAVADAVSQLTEKKLDVDALAEKYSHSIRARAAGTEFKTIEQILVECIQ